MGGEAPLGHSLAPISICCIDVPMQPATVADLTALTYVSTAMHAALLLIMLGAQHCTGLMTPSCQRWLPGSGGVKPLMRTL